MSTEYLKTDFQCSVGGLVPLSTSDWPGKLSCVIFLQGCPWRCSYCHNPHLWNFQSSTATVTAVPENESISAKMNWCNVFTFLKRRQGLLESVVFSGGEPTAHPELIDIIMQVKQMGYLVGLHTGGGYPQLLQHILNHIDWVAMDFKITFAKYANVTKAADSGWNASRSLQMIIDSGISYEVRTTVHGKIHTLEDILEGASLLQNLGVQNYYIQTFRKQGCINSNLIHDNRAIPRLFDTSVTNSLAEKFKNFDIRSS